jgi:hypothetical protein
MPVKGPCTCPAQRWSEVSSGMDTYEKHFAT